VATLHVGAGCHGRVAVGTHMRLAASPIQLHLQGCRVAGSARCRRCGAGVEEGIAHAILECTGIRQAVSSRILVFEALAPADGTRQAAPAVPRRETSKLLSGAHRWRDAMDTLHTVPARPERTLLWPALLPHT